MALDTMQKRDGRLAEYDERKIAAAIAKAFDAAFQPNQRDAADKLAAKVSSILEIEGLEHPEVEHVQDLMERVLMDHGFSETAKACILYRSEQVRVFGARLSDIYEDITYSSARSSDGKRENANINGDTAMGSMLKYGSEGAGAEAFERIRRITGYLVGTLDRWNDAKTAEEHDRVKHALTRQ